MSRPVGTYFHVPQGLSNATLLYVIMDVSAPANPDRFADIAYTMGGNTLGLNDIEADRMVRTELRVKPETLYIGS